MKKIFTIVLSVLLVASIINGVVLYRRNMDTKNALRTRENKIIELNKKIKELNEKLSKFHEQINDHTERVKEKENLIKRISQLEGEIKVKKENKEKKLAEFREQLIKHQNDVASLKKQIENKDTLVIDLRKKVSSNQSRILSLKKVIASAQGELSNLRGQLNHAQTRIRSFEEQVFKDQSGLEKLRGDLSNLKDKKNRAQNEISQLKSTYEAFIFNLKKQIENREVTIKSLEEKISVSFVNRILFDFGKTTIAPEGREILARVGDILKNVKDRKILVVGHTDNVHLSKDSQNKFPSNWELSTARASSVIRYFQKVIGIAPKNMEAMGRAFYEPIASNDTAEGRARNRRVEIIIAPKER